ncbi:YfhO family protein [Streptomyces sp. H27-C3]|uniref:YfhO family protein n=1 Tax=Streptomyces sp. H27-C3 TaxID=3046305 RepID=UPI0024BB1EFA|nr:YfhO family protein [Streptomyces sp. H27-C3]MDJ0460453.1 YfhO family protein [Streptomyces sp. H27-C3]
MPIVKAFRIRAAALAALITVVAVCTGDAVARSFPFGPRTRSVNDLGNQFVPYHAHLWDLLRGRADGGVLLNWQSGYGTSFLADIGTYVSSPFALLVGVFPRDEIDLAVYVITVLKMAVAAAAMTVLLLALREGGSRWWVAGVLGASYALCGWAVAEAIYNPMWMDGLIAFPLLCLVGEWARTGRHRVLGPVLVSLAWVANFYTAYMATLGATLVLVLRLLLDEEQAAGARLRVLLRAACTTLLGIGLAAPVLAVVFLGSTHAYPGWTRQFAPSGWSDVLARLLPATYSFFTPAVFVGTGALLLACTLVFNRAAPRRERRAWTLLAVAVAVSMQWGPTHLVWHVFATPNGSPYRQTFVLAGILVIAGWVSVSYGWPGRRALLGGGGVLVLAALGAVTSEHLTAWTYPLFVGGLLAAGGAVLLAARADLRGRRILGVAAAVLLVGATVGQAAATTAYADRRRLGQLDDYAPWGERQRLQAQAVEGADEWPAFRTETGREQSTSNDPLVVGGQGASYYSSHTPDVLTRTLAALGGGWTSGGRSVQSLDNPVTDAVFSVGARVHMPRDPHQGHSRPDDRGVTVTRAPAPPLVTMRPPGAPPRFGASPFRNQEALLGASVYTLPPTKQTSGTLRAACPAGSEVFLWAPDFFGTAALGPGPASDLHGGQPARRAATQPLGKVSADGRVAITLKGPSKNPTAGVADLPAGSVGCLDRERLDSAVAALSASGASSVRVSDSGVRAELPPGARGTAVFAMPRIAGWSCAVHGSAARPADSYLGLVAVPLDGRTTSLACDFSPPGLRLGGYAGGLSLLVLIAVAALPRVPARIRSRTRNDDDTHSSSVDHRPLARTA